MAYSLQKTLQSLYLKCVFSDLYFKKAHFTQASKNIFANDTIKQNIINIQFILVRKRKA